LEVKIYVVQILKDN